LDGKDGKNLKQWFEENQLKLDNGEYKEESGILTFTNPDGTITEVSKEQWPYTRVIPCKQVLQTPFGNQSFFTHFELVLNNGTKLSKPAPETQTECLACNIPQDVIDSLESPEKAYDKVTEWKIVNGDVIKTEALTPKSEPEEDCDDDLK